MNNKTQKQKIISVIVPVYNEDEVILIFHQKVRKILNSSDYYWELIYVNDGSVDRTISIIKQICDKEKNIALIDFTRNFGKEVALTAGLDYAKGDAVIVIDADLQDPPELIKDFIKYWEDGYDIVYGKRISRKGESIFKKLTAFLFYRVIQKASKIKIPEDTGDFRLLSKEAVLSLRKIREKNRFMKGLFSWVGYNQKAVLYERNQRAAGKTKWNYWRLWNFAIDGITSFTVAPLKWATYFGAVVSFCSFLYASFIIFKTIVYGDPVKGYPSLAVIVLFFGGLQMFSIGLIGEYLGRMFVETKNRPLYLIREHLDSRVDHNLEKKDYNGRKNDDE